MRYLFSFILAAAVLGLAAAGLTPQGHALLEQLETSSSPAIVEAQPVPTPHVQAASPRFLLPLGLDVEAQVGGMIAPDGTEAQCPLPRDMHLKNCGGSDGAGLCVFASLTHSGRWHDEPGLCLFEWMKTKPGGGYPEKVDRMIAQYCQEKQLARPDYIQVESKDLDVLELACGSGRMPGVTYGFSPTGRYGGQKIAHMVSLVHADQKHFAVLDNNYPGTVEWMTPEEFLRSYTSGSGNGWAVIPLKPGPPLPPHN